MAGKHAPFLNRPRIKAALAAINAMLAGAEGEGDWPDDVTRDQLEGAYVALHARLDASEALKERKTSHGL